MQFGAPITFDEALRSREVKALLPTDASAAELARLSPDLRERAVFSARTNMADHLLEIDRVTRSILTPGDAAPGQSVNPARARELLRDSLRRLGYNPDDIGAAPGSMRDLGSAARLNLIIDTNTKMATGYGWWSQGQDPAILDQWPAQEFLRVESRRAPRSSWPQRWRDAGGRPDLPGGRMVALKNDPVWTRLSRFNLPYPPYDYGSGMGVEDVTRRDAEALGLITPDEQPTPETRPFNDGLQASLSADARQAELREAILAEMGDQVEFVDGVLKFKRGAAA